MTKYVLVFALLVGCNAGGTGPGSGGDQDAEAGSGGGSRIPLPTLDGSAGMGGDSGALDDAGEPLEDGGLADGGDVLEDAGADGGALEDGAVDGGTEPIPCPVDPCPMVMYPNPGPWAMGCCRSDGICGAKLWEGSAGYVCR